MTNALKAYCENPTCSSSTYHVRQGQVTAPHWVTANIADVDGEWESGRPVHARHFCGLVCYLDFLRHEPVKEEDNPWLEIQVEFEIDESLGRRS